MQDFSLNRSMRQFLDLERSARFYAAVMDLWLQARGLTGLDYLEYRYEDLVGETPAVLGRICDWLEIPFDAGMADSAGHATGGPVLTPSYREVSEPVNRRAIGRWRRYESELAPVLEILAPYVKAFGYRT